MSVLLPLDSGPPDELPPLNWEDAWAGGGGEAYDGAGVGGAPGVTDPLYRASQAGSAWSR